MDIVQFYRHKLYFTTDVKYLLLMTLFSVSSGIWLISMQGDEPLQHFWQQTVYSIAMSWFTCFWNYAAVILTRFFNLHGPFPRITWSEMLKDKKMKASPTQFVSFFKREVSIKPLEPQPSTLGVLKANNCSEVRRYLHLLLLHRHHLLGHGIISHKTIS
jgi:hypothetical protein